MSANGVVNSMVRKISSVPNNHCTSTCNGIIRWDLSPILFSKSSFRYAVLVLNRPITQGQEFMKDFWNNATVRATVDGGTTQWDKYLSKMPQDIQNVMKIPDFINGDFDSITEDMLQKYREKGCKILHTADQNNTDFTKAIIEVHKLCQENKTEMEHLFAIGQTSGRLDQILGNIQSLFLAKEQHLISPITNLYILGDDAISWLLYPGEHEIVIPEATRRHKRAWCSLIPIGQSCESVSTTGLKWNLDKRQLKFGDLISTSNTFADTEEVTISCSHTILWSMRLPSIA